MLLSFSYKTLFLTLIVCQLCRLRYLLVDLHDKDSIREADTSFRSSIQNTDKCSAYCIRCINGKQSCQPNCFDNRKYFECQSECIESGRKDPQKCIEDKKCIQKCDKQCSKHWQGEMTKEIKSIILYHIERSSLVNPYGYKDELWKWAFIINSHENRKKSNKIASTAIKSRIVRNENKPTNFKVGHNTRLEKDVPTWDISYNDLLQFYARAYKERSIEWTKPYERSMLNVICCSKRNEVLLRRISWLYPNEYCWNRAYHFGRKITELVSEHHKQTNPSKTFPEPFKHYMFGVFVRKVKKGNAEEFVRWRMHVAPIIRLKDSELYILDPLLSEGPMKKDEYHAEIGNPENEMENPINHVIIKSRLNGYVTCTPETYDTKHDCFEPANNADDPDINDATTIPDDTNAALMEEWEEIRMVYERDPADILLQDVSTEYYPW